VDQRCDGGEEVPFLDLPTATSGTPARLALRLGVPLVRARVERLRGASFAITSIARSARSRACARLRRRGE
jgi:KDO2-lipid IV(A) lauroyltransferase